MKTLLISDVKSDWEIIRRIMRSLYSDLTLMCAVNPDEARRIVETDGPFGFFIIDCESKNYDPNELANSLTDLSGDRPIIFIGNPSFITDRIKQETYQDNEFNDQIAKPLERDDFNDEFKMKIDLALDWAKQEEFETSLEEINPEDFIKMKIRSFYLFKTFPYNIHMEITPTQYIKIISANKPYSIRTLSNYARKNVRYLYIQKDDQIKYLEAESTKCLKVMRNIDHKSKDIYLILLRSVTILHQYIMTIGVTPSVLTLANATTDVIIDHSKKNSHISKIFQNYPIFYEGVASKSLLTSLIADRLSIHMGWESETTRKKLSLASLLQDITIPNEAMAKINSKSDSSLSEYTEEEIKDFLEHPLKAAEVSRQFTTYPDLDYLIENHHELANKKGFPNRPSNTKFTSLNCVFNISQYIAADLDGEEITDTLIVKALKTMSREYNIGNFRDPYKIATKFIRLNKF